MFHDLGPWSDKPKHFLKILISLNDITEYGKLFQIATACEKRRDKKELCKSEVVQG